MAHLVLEQGTAPQERVELDKVTTLGRGLDMDVRLDDLTVSKRHARIIRDDRGRFLLEDLASSNGTFLNDVEVTTKHLQDGDRLRIGNSVFRFVQEPKAEGQPILPAEQARTMLDISEDTAASSVVSRLDMEEGEAGPETTQATVEELAKVNYRLRTVVEIAQSLGAALEEDKLLSRVLAKLFEVFPESERGFIILRDPKTGRLTPHAEHIETPVSQQQRLQISETILEYVLDQKQAILSTDLMSDERLPTSESMLDIDMRSVLCAPLLYEDEVLGFIQLDTSRVASNYDTDGLKLLAGIANQAALTIANARMHEQLIRRERLERDLRNARRIQTSFLPKKPPQVPGYQFADYYGTALAVGGDFYDFIELGDNQVVTVVGDVSGKGITAALMMAKMASNLRFFAGSRMGPAELLERLNRTALDSETDMFVTVLVMYLDTQDHTVTICNAGHCYPMRRRADGTVERMEANHGFPVGITAEAEFPATRMKVEPGDVICMFTDGVIEAMNEDSQQFGYGRLSDAMETESGQPEDVMQSIQKSIREHVGSAAQSDDLTLVCLAREGG